MLRVTPIYGSRWSTQSETPSCTLIEYGGQRILWNVGWSPQMITMGNKSGKGGDDSNHESDNEIFPCDFPDHDCLIVTDSSIQSVGGLPMYYKQQQERERKRKEEEEQEDDDDDTTSGATKDNKSNKSNKSNKIRTTRMYATYPIVQMGQMTLYDQHAALSLDGNQPPYSLEDIDNAFDHLISIKYSQTICLTRDISLTAHTAGHTIGGCYYILTRTQDDTSVVLTTSRYHVSKELHLPPASLIKYAASPDALVTYPGGVCAFRQLRRLAHPMNIANTKGGNSKKKDDDKNRSNKTKTKTAAAPLAPVLVTQAERTLVENVLSVLRRDGNVLLPVDASGRVLELILLLHKTWQRQRLFSSYHLVWLAPLVNNTIQFARSQLEWMHLSLGNQFDNAQHANGHPYALNGVKKLTHVRELQALLENSTNPTCVLASGLSMDNGPSRDVLLKWADNPDNAIVFTDSTQCYIRNNNVNIANKQQKQQQHRASTVSVDASAAATATDVVDDNDVTMQATSSSELPVAAPDSSGAAAVDDDNNVIVSNNASQWTAAAQLLLAWAQAKYEGREMDDSIMIDVPVPVRQPLQGAELKAYIAEQERLRLEQERKEEELAMLREVELAKGQLRLGEQQQQQQAGATGSTAQRQQDGTETTATTSSTSQKKVVISATSTTTGATTTRPRKKSRFDSKMFIKFSKPLHLTFEVREEAVGLGQKDSVAKYGIGESVGKPGEVLEDDYGIAVIPEKFTDIVSGVDPSKFAKGSGRIGEEVLKRGLGYGADSSAGGGGGKARRRSSSKKALATSSSAIARVSEDEDQDDELGDDDAAMGDDDEQAIEAMDLSEGMGIIRGRNGRPPTKITTLLRKLEVLAEISFVPLEGRVDARAARQSVRALQPRQVVVLGGPRKESSDVDDNDYDPTIVDEVTLLSKAAFSFATDKKPVGCPVDGETAELDVGHAAYAARLIDTPYRTREEKMSGEEPPAPPEPYEAKLGACTVSLLDAVATGQKVALDGSLVLAPKQSSGNYNDTPSLLLSDGEVLLTDLRAELTAAGMKAEYSAHAGYSQLVINGKVVVKKPSSTDNNKGEISIEGPLCEDFYTVRSVVNNQFVTL